MKALLAKDAFLRYPDHNKPFHIYCDASDLQLGAAILQDGSPVAFYSRKLTPPQRNYTVGEKELLSIVETLKEFRTMLYGCPNIHVYTDHKNNTFHRLQTQRVLRWRLFLEDYGVHFHYIKGESNSLADALSRLPFDERQNSPDGKPMIDQQQQSFYSMAIDNDDLLDCFVNLPSSEGIPFVLDYNTIAEAQSRDARLEQLRQENAQQFVQQLLAPNTYVWSYIPKPDDPWKIYLPTELLEQTTRWYHLALSHQGQNRLYDTMAMHLYHPDLRRQVEAVVSRCDTCQRYKQVLRGHGHTATREASLHPWREIAVDLIGPGHLKWQDKRSNFMHSLQSTQLPIWSNSLESTMKLPHTLRNNLKMYGYHAIQGHSTAFMIKEENLQATIFNVSCRDMASKAIQFLPKIPRPMQFVNARTKQLVIASALLQP